MLIHKKIILLLTILTITLPIFSNIKITVMNPMRNQKIQIWLLSNTLKKKFPIGPLTTRIISIPNDPHYITTPDYEGIFSIPKNSRNHTFVWNGTELLKANGQYMPN